MYKLRYSARIAHRYLGLVIGLQLLLWTVSGIYFSWTDIEKIRGSHFKNPNYQQATYNNLFPISKLDINSGIYSLELIEIDTVPYYWINKTKLFNATTGLVKQQVTKDDVTKIVKQQMLPSLSIKSISEVIEVSKHHEVRNKELPAYIVEFEGNNKLKAYISKQNGQLISIRHNRWRLFDFFWMTHTMDYKGRDNFNNLIIRIFSLLGLLTVLSGFWLWLTSTFYLQQKK